MFDLYILKDGQAVPEPDVIKWAEWFENTDNRRVALTITHDVQVSTVFLGIDHRFWNDGAPVLFETMVFGGKYDQYQERYTTLDEARLGHYRAVNRVRSAGALNYAYDFARALQDLWRAIRRRWRARRP